MNIPAFIFFIFLLQGICLLVGRSSAKKIKTSDDYFLASKNIKFFPLLMTFIATQIGGGMILGSTEEAYKYGWFIVFYPLGISLGLVFLSLGIGKKLAQLKISTIAQIFETAYKSTGLKKIASLLSILSLFMILVAQIIASNKFMVSLGIASPLIFIGFWSLVIAYTTFGGLKAVVATDVVQAMFFIIVFICSVGFVILNLPLQEISLLEANPQDFAFSADKLCGWLLMPFLFMVIEQDMGQRCFAAESPKIVSRATLCAAFGTFIIGLIPIFLGIAAKKSGIQAPNGGSVFMSVIEAASSPIFSALIGCAILAALISTADSLINAISSNLSQDFDLHIFKKNLRNSQIASAFIAIAAIFASYSFSNVVDLLIQSYELSVSCLFIPIVIAIFRGEGNALSAGLAILFGAAAFILFRIVTIPFPQELASVLFSFIGFRIGDLFVKNTLVNKAVDIN